MKSLKYFLGSTQIKWFIRMSFFLSIFLFHLLNARLDPEVHHDGYIFTAAVAVSDGLIPNKDFFAQYGPVTPLIQGLWLKITEPTLLNLRILNVIFLMITSWLTFSILRNKCREFIAIIFVAAYNISTPMILPYLLPWPSVLSTLIILACMKLLTDPNQPLNSFRSFVTGCLLSIGVFVRVHVLVVFFLLIIVFLSLKLKTNVFRFFILGFSSTFGVSVCLMLFSGSLNSYLDQVIFYPANAYPGISAGWKVAIANFFVFTLFFFYPLIYFVINRVTYTNHFFVYFYIFSLITLSVSLILVSRIKLIPIIDRSYRNPYYLLHFLAQNFLLFVPLCSIGLFLIWLLRYLSSVIGRDRKLIDSTKLFTLAICLGSISQLYPGPDQLHAWWIAPIFISALPVWGFPIKQPLLISGIFFLILFNGYRNYSDFLKPRFSYSSAALKGMLGTGMDIEENMSAVSKLIGYRSAYFHCAEGAYASASGKFLSAVPDFVSWGPQTKDKLLSPGLHFSCDSRFFPIGDKTNILWQNAAKTAVIWRRIP